MPTPAQASRDAQQHLLALHRTLFPERYDDVETLRWTTELFDDLAGEIEDACAELEIPGFVSSRAHRAQAAPAEHYTRHRSRRLRA